MVIPNPKEEDYLEDSDSDEHHSKQYLDLLV